MIKLSSRLFKTVALVMLAGSFALPSHAQEQSDRKDPGPPPNFTPPPPPNFSPPSAPPRFVPPSAPTSAPGSNQSLDTDPMPATNRNINQNRPRPPQEELTARPSKLVREDDPRMRETVGLIRIPEMGTNEVLEMLENFTGKPILRHQSLPTVKITFYSQGALTRGQAITAIESLLSLNGIAITPLGDLFLKAVPANIITSQGAPIWEGTTLDAEPTQKIYEKIFRLDFLNPTEAAGFIQPLMSSGNALAFEKSGLIVVNDALINLQRIERILNIIDKPAAMNSEILFFELENIDAQNALRRLQQIQQGPLKRQLENNTSFDADERTNQLIVFTHPTNKALIENLVDKLDIDVAPVTATKIYSIRYADSTEVVSIIEQIVSGQREVRNETGGDANNPRTRQQAAQARQNNQTVAAARAEATNLQFSDFLTIVPDERANTIVASGTHNDLRYLEQIIEEIDTLLAQVRIEVVICEVRLSDSDTRGIDSFGFQYNVATPAGENSLPTFNDDNGTNNVDQKYATPGNFYGVSIPGVTWGPDGFGIQFVLNAAKTNSNVTVLSAPTIVTTHNKEAVVSVGEERPVVTGVTTTNTGSGAVSQDQVQFKDIKLELKVTPLIGSNGIVQLEIDQQIQSVIDVVKINNNEQPVIGTRKATSYVSVADNELIVLGGLQSIDAQRSEGRMAILGKIPVLGDLFTSNRASNIRNELLIFIRPTIIRTTDEAHRDAVKQINVLEAAPRINEYLENGTFRDLNPEVEEEADKDDAPRRRFGK